MAHSFENVCEIIPDWPSEGLEKSLAGAVYEQEKEETETSKCRKNISDTLASGSCTTFLFLSHFDVICDL